jgi:agmatinase
VRPPKPHPFLAAESGESAANADAIVVGLPFDGGVSFRSGAAEGPSGIREFSESIESFSPRAQRDLADIRLVDLGDVDGAIAELPSAPLSAFLGGDHSVTPHVVRNVAARAERLAVVGFDAHLDLREDYPGDHACTYRRISELGVPCSVFGPRSGARREWDDVPKVLSHCSTSLDMPDDVRRGLEGRDVYVTLDIDVLDPAAAPGTGNPEAGGPSFNELLEAVEALQGLRIVAFDVVEVSPPLDPSGVTQAAAAVLAREMLLRFSSRLS